MIYQLLCLYLGKIILKEKVGKLTFFFDSLNDVLKINEVHEGVHTSISKRLSMSCIQGSSDITAYTEQIVCRSQD